MTKLSKFMPIVIAGFVGVAAGYAIANETSDHSGHHTNGGAVSVYPTEQGQSGFAAIAEIVSILENDPDTDWSKVNINALREHLVDMDALTLDTSVSMDKSVTSIAFIAEGKGATLRALQNMVPAHANELNKMDEWAVSGKATATGATLTVTPSDVSELPRIEALGFFGLMATGAHHQAHHLGMASGKMLH
ncbi:MAG: hypothetical protein ABJO86_14380 [Lentilitoribacter sp.]